MAVLSDLMGWRYADGMHTRYALAAGVIGLGLTLWWVFRPATAVTQMEPLAVSPFHEANEALPERQPGVARVVFLGDSITEEWERVRPAFFSIEGHANRGLSGETTLQMAARFQLDVIDLHPDVVVILAGTNDLAGNQGPTTPERIVANLSWMTEQAQAEGIDVVLCSVLPASVYPWARHQEPRRQIPVLNEQIRAYAREAGVTYLDLFRVFRDEDNGILPELTRDGVHLSPEGYAVMEPMVEEVLGTLLVNRVPLSEPASLPPR